MGIIVVSDELKFASVHIRRTAGSSRKAALEEFCRPSGGMDATHPKVKRHGSACDLCGLLGRERFESFFTFGFVRNPWDRLVSVYLRRCKLGDAGDSFRRWLLGFDLRKPPGNAQNRLQKCGWGEQVGDLMICGVVAVDFVGRFEFLERDWAIICERIGVFRELPASRSKRVGGYREFYDGECRDFVGELCARDIGLFGYSF